MLLKGPRAEHLRVLRAVGALDRLAHENHVFSSLELAIEHAREHVVRADRADRADGAALTG